MEFFDDGTRKLPLSDGVGKLTARRAGLLGVAKANGMSDFRVRPEAASLEDSSGVRANVVEDEEMCRRFADSAGGDVARLAEIASVERLGDAKQTGDEEEILDWSADVSTASSGLQRSAAASRSDFPLRGVQMLPPSGSDGVVRRLQAHPASTLPSYEKHLTVSVELIGDETIPVVELIRAIRLTCGGLLVLRNTGDKLYEATMSNLRAKDKMLDGFKIGDVRVVSKDVCNDEMMVSFMSLPGYITDEAILQKLIAWGVTAVSPIKRRMWPNTNIADGTRYVKVRFTATVQSLPYSTKFDTALGFEYYRVIHDRQAKVCRLCLQPGHIMVDCPDFSCHACGGPGHFARSCSQKRAVVKKCVVCCNAMSDCICNLSSASNSPVRAPLVTCVAEDGGQSFVTNIEVNAGAVSSNVLDDVESSESEEEMILTGVGGAEICLSSAVTADLTVACTTGSSLALSTVEPGGESRSLLETRGDLEEAPHGKDEFMMDMQDVAASRKRLGGSSMSRKKSRKKKFQYE